MNKLLTAILILTIASVPVFGSDEKLPPQLLRKTEEKTNKLFENNFSISSDDMDPADSLNRIAGNIDRGFASSEQSYQSRNASGVGPTAHEKAQLAKQAEA